MCASSTWRRSIFNIMKNQKIWVGTLDELFNHHFEKKRHFGYVYAIELEHGVKIGKTSKPHQRMTQLQGVFEKYGNRQIQRIAVSPIHSNYSQNETALLKTFGYVRRDNTEMTDAPFDFVIGAMERLLFSHEFNDKTEENLNSLKEIYSDLWGISERSAKQVISLHDGYNDIEIKVGNAGIWWLNINGESYKMIRDEILDFIVWYAFNRDIWDILEYLDMIDDPEEDVEPHEPCVKWMLDAVSKYSGRIVIESIWAYILDVAKKYEKKYDLYLDAMGKIAKERGYEYSLPPFEVTFEQVMNEDYEGLEPIDPSTLRSPEEIDAKLNN